MLIAAAGLMRPYFIGRRLSDLDLEALLFLSLLGFPAVLCGLFDLLPTKWPDWIRSMVAATGGLLAISAAVVTWGIMAFKLGQLQ
jgi:hypothetical protein